MALYIENYIPVVQQLGLKTAKAVDFSAAPSVALPSAVTLTGGTITSTSATAFGVGPNGATNPTFNIDCSTTSAVTGLNLKSAAAGGGFTLSLIGGNASENLTINAKGPSGIVVLPAGSTIGGAVPITTPITSSSATAFTVGQNGVTNPAFNIDASTATSTTGLNIKSSASGGMLLVSVTSGQANEQLKIDAKGSGKITLGSVSTGIVELPALSTIGGAVPITTPLTSSAAQAFTVGRQGGTNPAFNVDASTGVSVTGFNIKAAAASGGVALSATSSAAAENLTLDALGTGTISLASVSTGVVNLGQSLTFTGAVARTIQGPGTGGLTMTVAAGPVTVSTTTSGTLSLTSAGALVATSVGTSSWANTSGSLTLSTVTSGTLAVTSAGALNLTGAAASLFTATAGGLTINSTSAALALQTTTSGAITMTPAAGSGVSITSANAAAFAVGLNGSTNPALNIDASTGVSVTGFNIKSAVSGGGIALSAISSAVAENLTLDAKGVGTLTLNGTATGAVTIGAAMSFAANKGVTVVAGTSAFDFSGGSGIFKTSTGAVTIGNGAISITGAISTSGNPAFDYSGSSSTFKTSTGVTTIGGNLAGGGGVTTVDFSSSTGTFKTSTGINTIGGNVVPAAGNPTFDYSTSSGIFKTSTGVNTIGGNLVGGGGATTVDFSGSTGTFKTSTGINTMGGATNINSASATALTVATAGAGLTNPAFQVDASTASQATGVKVTGAAAGGKAAIAAVSSGAAESLTIDGKTSGTVGLGNISTGIVIAARGARKSLVIGTTLTTLSAQNVTPTAAQLIGGIVAHVTVTGAGTCTLDNGTNISAAIEGVAVGDSFTCILANTGNQTSTITTNTGLTLVGTVAVPTLKNAVMTFYNTGAGTYNVYCTVSA